jgi:uncharacterized membrane protein SirB2
MTLLMLHVLISLVGIASGAVVLIGLLRGRRLDGWTGLFLATTVLTSATGYLLPADHILPSHIVGAISLAVLAIAIVARYRQRLAGSWRWIYVVSAVAALYLNVFVGVVQAFLKVPVLKAAAPTQSEPAFAAAQFVTLVLFIALGAVALVRFRAESVHVRPAARVASQL